MTAINYETDRPQSFPALLQEWRAEMKLERIDAANALGVPVSTFMGWLAGRPCGQYREPIVRQKMQQIAKQERK